MRQKIGLATTLCLSAVMAIVAIIRIAGLHLPNGAVDDVWASFWLQQECSVAVTMVSASATRAFFVTGQQHHDEHQGHNQLPRYLFRISSAFRRYMRYVLGMENDQPQALESSSAYDNGVRERGEEGGEMILRSTNPQIPSATITGVHTALDQVKH